MSDYRLVRADEAFLVELPWPMHGSERSAHRTPRADREHQHFREVHTRHDENACATRALNVSYPHDHIALRGRR